MTVSYVADRASAGTNTDATSFGPTVTPGAPGRLLIATFAWGRGSSLSDALSGIAGTLSVVDESGAAGWTVFSELAVPNNNTRLVTCYGYSVSTSPGTILATFPAAQGNCSWKVSEYSASDGQARVDLTNISEYSGPSANPTLTLPSSLRAGSIVHTALGHNNTSVGISQPTDFTSIGSKISRSSPTVAHTGAYEETSPPSSFSWIVSGANGKVAIGFEIYDYVAPAGGTSAKWWDGSTVADATLKWWDGSTLIDVTGMTWHSP